MKTLYLMRHSKSVQELHGLADIDRPLLQEGITIARLIAEHLKERKVKILHLVSSPAVRAVATAEIMAKSFNISKDAILIYDELYKPDIPAFEDCIFSLPDDWDHVMLVSHNPGISMFAANLTQSGDPMPTSGVLSFSFDMERWINLNTSKPTVNFFIHPKNINV